MNSLLVKKGLLLFLGGSLGGIVGYFVGGLVAYKLEQNEQKEMLEELSQKEGYLAEETPLGDLPGDTEIADAPKEEVVKNKKLGKVDYTKYADNKPEITEVLSKYSTTIDVTKLQVPVVPPEPVEKKEDTGPEIVTREKFEGNESGNVQQCLVYYSQDKVLADLGENAIDAPEVLVGDALLHFGEYGEGEDVDIIYVQNDALATDYEISRIDESYAEKVLGIVNEKPKRRGKKDVTKKNGSHKQEDENDE